MHILLPPSETKRPGGGNSSLVLDSLSMPSLTSAREAALEAVRKLSSKRAEAMRILKLSEKQSQYIEDNQTLLSSSTMPAIERYTGVLFDALDVESTEPQERLWIDSSVRIQSSLFGLMRADDQIPAYRLSASTSLPGLKRGTKPVTLKQFWVHAHAGVLEQLDGFVLDLRSKDYAALAPFSAGANQVWVNIVTRSGDGTVRALNHFNKAAKGQLVRILSRERPEVRSRTEFADWANSVGIECSPSEDGQLQLVADSVRVESGHPASAEL